MLRKFLTHIGYWAVMGLNLAIIRFTGIRDSPAIKVIEDDSLIVFIEFSAWFIVIGLVSFLSDVLVERRRKTLTYGRSILVKSGTLFFATLLIFVISLIIGYWFLHA